MRFDFRVIVSMLLFFRAMLAHGELSLDKQQECVMFLAMSSSVIANHRLLGKLEDVTRAGQLTENGYLVLLDEFRDVGEAGDLDAQLQLGKVYNSELCGPRDEKETEYWYKKAAQQGDGEAQYRLGQLYMGIREVVHGGKRPTGKPLLLDYEEGVYWLLKSAEQNDKRAQGDLGFLYGKERPLKKDLISAYMWLTLAAGEADTAYEKHMLDLRDKYAREMSSVQIARAKRLVRKWRKEHVEYE